VLCLLLRLGRDQYAIDVRHVVEVLPLVEIKAIPKASPALAGVFNYHGNPVPVVDLAADVLAVPARRELHSRIVVVSCPGEGGSPRLVGLLVEHATSTLKCAESDFSDTGIGGAAYLGGVRQHREAIVQLIDPARMLTETFAHALAGRTP
jgi:chemotaxis-related protein WspB